MAQDGHPALDAAEERDHREHLSHEMFTMALYVAICLLAALAVVHSSSLEQGEVVGVVWGTTLGLAIVHYFSFRVAGQLVTKENAKQVSLVAAAQMGGAAIVAAVVTLALLVTPTKNEREVAMYVVAALIGLMGYLVGRQADAGRWRAVGFGVIVLVLAVLVASLKIRLTH